MNEPTDSIPCIATVVLIDRRQPTVADVLAVDADFVHHHGERDIWPLRTHGKYEATMALIRTGGAA